MGLYSTFNTSQYYDDDSPIKKNKQSLEVEQKKDEPKKEYKKPHQVEPPPVIKKKSLYAEAQEVASTKSEYSDKDFRDLYRVGQMVSVYEKSGKIRTKQGRIVEIVDRDLMYVGMEDTYKDVNGNWLIDFVTSKDIITKL